MKNNIIVIQLLFILFIDYQSYSENLYKIKENGLYGYINDNGKVKIEPKFINAGEFSEGLAPVRENGYYGFIDTTGKYVLIPFCDYAESFKEGHAKIFIDGVINFIDKNGKRIIPFECSEIFSFKNKRAIVYTKYYENNRKSGVIDEYGNLIVDTVYSIIASGGEGRYIVQQPYEYYGVIDSIGNIVVPCGTFRGISGFHNGFAKVSWEDPKDNWSAWNLSQGYINIFGDLVLKLEHSYYIELSDIVSEDSLFIASEYFYGTDGKSYWTGERKQGGIMNLKGEWVCTDSINYRFVYLDEKICTVDTNSIYHFTDSHGKSTGSKFFYHSNGEKTIYSFAGEKDTKKERKFGLIDTSLKFIIEPFFELVQQPAVQDSIFIFGKYLTDENDNYIPNGDGTNLSKAGICKIDGNILLDPKLEQIDNNGFINGLLLAIYDGKPAYINKEGEIVWRQKSKVDSKLIDLDIDYQLRTNFSKYYGWQPIENKPTQELTNIDYKENNITVIISNNKTIFDRKYNGISLYLINDCEHSVSAPSVDGALFMVLQAKDKYGNWKNIESYPTSFCGNSYVPTSIQSKFYRKYSIPKYSGVFKTKLRAFLQIYNDGRKSYVNIYSNEIDGHINPAQFWRTQDFFYLISLLDK